MTHEQRTTHRRAVVEKHAETGLSAAEFCREHRIKVSQFYRWHRKFRNNDEQSRTSTGFLQLVPCRNRSKKRPLDFLAGYQGYVHADAYSGYDELFRKEGIVEVGCWVHYPDKFDDATLSRPHEATEVMARIAKLYLLEKQCADMGAEDRRRFRQEHAKPVIDAIFARLEDLKGETIPSEPLRKAVDYALNQRAALYRYLDDGRLKPDNNTAENAIRPLAVGRKNWLFAGRERGARATALFLDLIRSCKACEVNPWQYFDDVFRRIMSHPVSRLRELLPDRWKPLTETDNGVIAALSNSPAAPSRICQRASPEIRPSGPYPPAVHIAGPDGFCPRRDQFHRLLPLEGGGGVGVRRGTSFPLPQPLPQGAGS